MTNPTFTIYIQRKNEKGDDVIRISRANISGNHFRVTYDDETSNMTRPREMFLTEAEVLEYVGTIVNGLSLDKDPFAHFQIMPPAAPSIQFDIVDLKAAAVQQVIYSSLQFTLRHWVVQDAPVVRRQEDAAPSPRRRRPVMNPEDTEEEDEEMPPLYRHRPSGGSTGRGY
jgi:hypothetical protein